MALLLSDIHLPALITSTLSEHAQFKSLPWNNLDQLSCLWGVFTKCKKNIRDGFRLENLSWRLWYRQSVLQKKVEPKTSEDINFGDNTNDSFGHPLRRTRSLPDLSQWSQQKHSVMTKGTRSGTMTPARRHSKPVKPKQKFFITPPTAVEEPVEEALIFTKKSKTSNKPSKITTPSLLSSKKPVSLLSNLLQQQQQQQGEMMDNTDSGMGGGGGLRRCQSRYCRLDQFFLHANNIASPTA